MTYEEREGLRRLIDRATRARLRAARETREPERSGPKPRLSEEEALDAVERVLADGLARTVTGLATEVGLARKPTARAVERLLGLGRVEQVDGERPGWVAFRIRAELRSAA